MGHKALSVRAVRQGIRKQILSNVTHTCSPMGTKHTEGLKVAQGTDQAWHHPTGVLKDDTSISFL